MRAMHDASAGLPRTVLMTTDTVGGVCSYSLLMAEQLAARRIRVCMAMLGERARPEQRDALRRIPGVEVHESGCALEWTDNPWQDVARSGRWLLDLERRIRPDVVHLNGYCHAALAWRAPTVVVAHSCVFSWWKAVFDEAPPPRYARYRTEVARGLHAARAVVAPTHAMLRALEHHYGKVPHAIVIPNACRLPSAPIRRKKSPLVFAAGRLWDQAKNITTLSNVASRLSWPVYVAGSDVHPDEARRAFPALQVLGLLGAGEMDAWMQRASIFAAPARYEPFGLAVLEAAHRGCALVLGDIPSFREVWGDAAVFVRPNDDRALHAALTSLIKDKARRSELAQRARARAELFTPGRILRDYLSLYRTMLEIHSPEAVQPCA